MDGLQFMPEPVANARGADDMIVSGATSAQMK